MEGMIQMAKVEKVETVYAAPEIQPLPVTSAHVEHVGHSRKSVIVYLPANFKSVG
jgi:hypothetical protein